MKINRVRYELVTVGEDVYEVLYRRYLNGLWERECWDQEENAFWKAVESVDDVDKLEAQYQQEKEPPRPTMGQMTDEHIITLAKHQLDLADNEIHGVARGEGWVRLYWVEGEVFATNDVVGFATSPYDSRPVSAGLHLLRLIASWGYDVMMEDER